MSHIELHLQLNWPAYIKDTKYERVDDKSILITQTVDLSHPLCPYVVFESGTPHLDKRMERLFLPIEDLECTVRTTNCLLTEGIEFIGDIVCHDNLTERRPFDKLHLVTNFGRKSFNDLIEGLGVLGFHGPIVCPDYWCEREKKTGKKWYNEFFLLKNQKE